MTSIPLVCLACLLCQTVPAQKKSVELLPKNLDKQPVRFQVKHFERAIDQLRVTIETPFVKPLGLDAFSAKLWLNVPGEKPKSRNIESRREVQPFDGKTTVVLECTFPLKHLRHARIVITHFTGDQKSKQKKAVYWFRVRSFALTKSRLKKEKLLVELDADYKRLLPKEDAATRRVVRKIAILLFEMDQGSHWPNYIDAVRLILRHRPKAAIPLLMKYMMKHSVFSTSHGVMPEYADALTMLTGVYIPRLETSVDRELVARKVVLKFAATWWTPNKDKCSTELKSFSKKQRTVYNARVKKRKEEAKKRRRP